MKNTVKELASYVPPVPESQLKAKYGLKQVVRLSANENPYGTSPAVAKAVIEAVPKVQNYYPDSNCTALRNLIAKRLSVPAANIVFGCGLDEIIAMVSRVFLTPGDEVLVSEPTFSEYQLNAELEGANVKMIPVNDQGQNDLPAFLEQINENVNLIWLCNPNNPTGGLNSLAAIQDFLDQVPEDILVIIDEAYIEYAEANEAVSAVPLLSKYDNVAIMRTFSKAYGLASYRVGYIIMDSNRAKYMQSVRLPYNLNTLSQVAAIAALNDSKFVEQTVERNQVEREKWVQFLSQINFKFYPSAANFIYFKVPDAELITSVLMQNGYQVRSGQQPNWIRVTIGKPVDNQVIQNLIKSTFKC
ncbi:histidinol-phosphate transaminase [Lactobacillus sp. Sy-1]|uniref:histidinol-phosphate transaminase n=1 Tax=Lactobacillus sp. Sy-1 TaxID=2109645 RepID=UPI001C5AADCC|nr:histidinol-phosphate transaminase [Lactobacillus sp. Sy-1]MBW1606406.1 histidinol-phosphate transaminase [Lactobacillus sp. Sy-1]